MHTFVANFLRYVTSKNYLNWIIFSQVFAKVKRVTFFETQCISKMTCEFAVVVSEPYPTPRGSDGSIIYHAVSQKFHF